MSIQRLARSTSPAQNWVDLEQNSSESAPISPRITEKFAQTIDFAPSFGTLRKVVAFACVLTACTGLVACSDDESTSNNGGNGTDTLAVTIQSPTQYQVFQAPNGVADIPLQAAISGLEREDDIVQTSLDGSKVGQLDASRAYTFAAVSVGIHRLAITAARANGEVYATAAATDSVDIIVVGPCTTATDCDDGDECTWESCGDNGFCEYYAAIGDNCEPPPEDPTGGYTGPICKTDVDCAKFVAGQGPCIRALCNTDTSYCYKEEIQDDGVCDDGNPCTIGEKCVDLECVGGTPTVCDDGNSCTVDVCDPEQGCTTNPDASACDDNNPCTTDTCDLATGCSYAPATGPCEDGDACTENDRCSAGVCVGGSEKSCPDDGDFCNGSEICDSAAGGCISVEAPYCGDGNPDLSCGEECDDGNDQTGDGCTPACVVEVPPCLTNEECDDGNVCTSDFCDSSVGCQNPPNSAPCDDANACTETDVCVAGTCVGTPKNCDDGIACTTDSCANGACVQTENDGACPPGGGACTAGACDASSGCIVVPVSEGGACNDGNACTTGETCQSGSCVGGTAVVCNDGNGCTQDSCNPASGCTTSPLNGTACNDGDMCTTVDTCQNGVCVGSGVSPGCQPTPTVCAMYGPSGTLVECELKLVSQNASMPKAAAIQFNLTYDNAFLKFVNFVDEICIVGVGCFEAALTGAGASTMSTGHTVTSLPSKPSDWIGKGSVVIVNLTNPTIPLTDAHYDAGGAVVGDPVMFTIVMEMKQTVDIANAKEIVIDKITAAQASSEELKTTIKDKTIITSL